MFVLNKFFTISHYKKIAPVVLLSCVTLIGCSNSNTPSESPKQIKLNKKILVMILLLNLKKNITLSLVFMHWTQVRIKPLLTMQMIALHLPLHLNH